MKRFHPFQRCMRNLTSVFLQTFSFVVAGKNIFAIAALLTAYLGTFFNQEEFFPVSVCSYGHACETKA